MKNFAVFLILFILSSCIKNQTSLEETLTFAGTNRSELEYVLKYYSEIIPHEQKYKAALFLVSNMRYHSSGIPVDENENPHLEALVREADSILYTYTTNMDDDSLYTANFERRIKSIKDNFKKKHANVLSGGHFPTRLEKKYDCQTLKSDWLINHIDAIFSDISESVIKDDEAFHDFCEYILPYKSVTDYPLTNTVRQYTGFIGKYLNGIPEDSVSHIIKRYNFVVKQLKEFFPPYPYGYNRLYGMESISFSGANDCVGVAHICANTLRANGIPAVVDFYSAHKSYRGKHFYVTIPEYRNHKSVTFHPEYSLPVSTDSLISMGSNGYTLNIYRMMYSEQKESPFFLKNQSEFIPELLSSPFIKDVSSDYLATGSLRLPFNAKTDNRLAYLAVFSNEYENNLAPVTWGLINAEENEVTFHDIILQRLYFPVYYNEKHKLECFGNPFYWDGIDTIAEYPNYTDSGAIVLSRKFPVKDRMTRIAKQLIGTTILGSNSEDFEQTDIIAQINCELMPYFQDEQRTL